VVLLLLCRSVVALWLDCRAWSEDDAEDVVVVSTCLVFVCGFAPCTPRTPKPLATTHVQKSGGGRRRRKRGGERKKGKENASHRHRSRHQAEGEEGAQAGNAATHQSAGTDSQALTKTPQAKVLDIAHIQAQP
jgi:hypothetical protein